MRGPAGSARKPALSRATTPASAKSSGSAVSTSDGSSSQDTDFLCSNSPSEASSSARGTDISAAEAATDSDDDGRIVAEVISEVNRRGGDAKAKAGTPCRASSPDESARRAAEKEKKEKEKPRR